jgi:predicted Fe-Mo cluster-binding NifX family protein
MKICFPVEDDLGIDSKIFGHFGSAPYFIIYDTASGESGKIKNNNDDHEHETCNPVVALGQSQVDAVICRGMGMRAIQKLAEAGVAVLTASGMTVREVIDEYKSGKTKILEIDGACRSHQCH